MFKKGFMLNMLNTLKVIVATLAPVMNCIDSFPQLYKSYTTKRVKDLSLHSLFLFLFTSVLWLLHGYFIQDSSLIFSGVITTLTNLFLLALYFMYTK
jgi:uncharacterized protein with PQ loop repeat